MQTDAEWLKQKTTSTTEHQLHDFIERVGIITDHHDPNEEELDAAREIAFSTLFT